MRYPSGNFASGYHWKDGIGPKVKRPTTRDLAWQSLETNQFGTDEFVKLARNTFEHPNLITNQPYQSVSIKDGVAQLEIPPISVVAIRFACA